MANDDLIPVMQGTWFNIQDPYWGYLKLEEYKSISEGGECVAVIHAKHGRNEPPIWYRGVWRPTDNGYEAIAGPYHWTRMSAFSTPPTADQPNRLMFRSKLNGWGDCNMGRLTDEEEQKFVDSLTNLPVWQEVKTFWRDYPSATWEESKKHLRPFPNYNGPPASRPEPVQFPEHEQTHNGGQTMTPQGGGVQPEGAGEQPPSPPNDSDGPGQGPQQANTPQSPQNPQPPANSQTQGNGADKDGDGHVIDDVATGRVFKKDNKDEGKK